MMTHPKMAAAPFRKRDPGDEQGPSPQGIDSVDMITRLHAAETQSAAGADTAGSGAQEHKIGFQQAAAGGQGGIDIDRFKITPEGMTAGYRAAEQPLFPQPGNSPAVSKGQGCSIGHDQGDPAGGAQRFQNCHSRCDHAVQLPDEYRHPLQIFKPGQMRPVAGSLLLAAEHTHLPGGIAEFHDMAAARKGWRRAVKIVFHKMVPAAAQRQLKGCCIQQQQIALFHPAGQKIVIQRRALDAVNDNPQFADGTAIPCYLTGYTDPLTDHSPADSTFAKLLHAAG